MHGRGDLKDRLAALGIDRWDETGVKVPYNAAMTPCLRLRAVF